MTGALPQVTTPVPDIAGLPLRLRWGLVLAGNDAEFFVAGLGSLCSVDSTVGVPGCRGVVASAPLSS